MRAAVRLAGVGPRGERAWWTLERADRRVVVRQGEEGRSGTIATRAYASVGDAWDDADRQVAAALARGLRWDPPLPPPAPALAAVDDAPEDGASWAVWADHLCAQGDPEGERLMRALLLEGGAPLAERLHALAYRLSARLGEGASPRPVRDALRQMAGDPRARFLVRLAVRTGGAWDRAGLGEVAATLLASAPPWPLRSLTVVDASNADPGPLAAAIAQFWRLESLVLSGPATRPGPLDLPRLVSYSRVGLTAHDAEDLARSTLPALRALALTASLSAPEQLWRAVGDRRLTRLGLGHARLPSVAAALAGIDTSALTHLDVRGAVVSDDDARSLCAMALPALATVDLRDAHLSAAACARLTERWSAPAHPALRA
jgi:hypothetical protein